MVCSTPEYKLWLPASGYEYEKDKLPLVSSPAFSLPQVTDSFLTYPVNRRLLNTRPQKWPEMAWFIITSITHTHTSAFVTLISTIIRPWAVQPITLTYHTSTRTLLKTKGCHIPWPHCKIMAISFKWVSNITCSLFISNINSLLPEISALSP